MRSRVPILLLAGWYAIAVSAPAAGAPLVSARDAWIRWLPAELPAAGYVTLVNTGSEVLRVVGVETVDYSEVSMHQTVDHHGMSEMRSVPVVTLQPNATLRFAPGGYHLMLVHPRRPVRAGDRVDIVFRFSDGRSQTVAFAVRAGE